MRRLIIIFIFLSSVSFGQIIVRGVTVSGVSISTSTTVQSVILPQNWATKIIDPIYDVTRVLGPTGGDFYLCSTGDACFASLQQAYCDWVAAPDQNWHIVIEHGTLIQTGLAHTCTQTGATQYRSLTIIPKIVSSALPTKFIVFDSDTPLSEGRTVCSNNTDDSGVRNPPTGDISTWWIGTNYGCDPDRASMWTIEGNWVGSGNNGTLVQGGQWDAITNLGPSHVVFKNAEFRQKPGTTSGGILTSATYGNLGTITLFQQAPSNWHFENIYIHGDAKDWCNAVGGITQYSINTLGSGYVAGDTGTISTGSGTATYIVNTTNNGGIITVTFGGSGYSTGTGIATTATSGVGTGLKINIYAVAGTSPSCVTSFNTGGQGTNSISVALSLEDCVNCSLKYSYTDYMVRPGAEGHDVGIQRSVGPIAIVHNWLSGQAINLLTGGIAQTDPLYSLNDLEVRGNKLTEPPSWIGTVYQGRAGGSGITFKNRMEFKTGNRMLIDGNIMEYSDTSGAQSGQCFEINPRGCSAGLQCDNFQNVLQNITVTNNICRHALSGFTIIGRSGYPTNGGGIIPPLRNVSFFNNLIYDVGNSNVYDHFKIVGNPYGFRLSSGGEALICNGTKSGIIITLVCSVGLPGLASTQISPGDYIAVTDCSDSTWNLPTGNFPFTKGPIAQIGTIPSGSTVVYNSAAAVSSTATGCIVSNVPGQPNNVNVIHNTIIMDATQAGINSVEPYSGVLSSLYTDTGCTGSGPNNSTTITALSRIGGVVTASVTSLAGWDTTLNVNAQTIVEVSGVTPSDLNGTFYYLGQSSGKLTWSQAGANEVGSAFGTAAQKGTCPANIFAQNNTWKNNLIAVNTTSSPSCPATPAIGWPGWLVQGDGNNEGCASGFNANTCSENMLDSVSSVATYADFNGRCPTKYTEMGGINAGANPPITLTFPASAICSGLTASSACVGLKTMMNGVVFDGNNANFLNYTLDPTSVYHNTADDSTDFGVSPSIIQSAINSHIYVCNSLCGTGPLPDTP